jgi:hypothetical protein
VAGRAALPATSRTDHLLAIHTAPPQALVAGFQRALLAGSIFLLAAAFIALRATNTRGEPAQTATETSAGTTKPPAAVGADD